jgi:phospholipase C
MDRPHLTNAQTVRRLDNSMDLPRRNFLRAVGAGAAGLTLGAGIEHARAQNITSSVSVPLPRLVNGSVQVQGSVTLPPADTSGIDHIVVVTMENRSFDHFLGWLPNADGRQSGLTYKDANGAPHASYDLGHDFEGCGHQDPNHSYSGSRVAYDNGSMDGFLRAGKNDIFSIGYYSNTEVPFYAALARNFLVCDRYFASILGPTFPNRMFLWSAQTDRLGDDVQLSSLPTIFDRLQSAGVSHKYYFNNLPYLAFWGLKYISSTALFSEFLTSAAAGTLPAVSFVDPRYTVLDDSMGNDDHPHANIRNGEAFLSEIYRAVATGPAWAKTVLIITFDEWGGFFEHVAPPRVTPANPHDLDTDQVNGQVLLGFRIPAVIVSPFTVNTQEMPMVTHTVFDHTSILKLLEWRWGLQPLTQRDASLQIGNMATSLNFLPSSTIPNLPPANSVFALPCFLGGIFSSEAVTSAGKQRLMPASTEWSSFAATPHAQQWLQHPMFRDALAAQSRQAK